MKRVVVGVFVAFVAAVAASSARADDAGATNATPRAAGGSPPARITPELKAAIATEALPWHSPGVLTDLASHWRTVYRVETNAVIVERRLGSGSIVLATDSYFVSNEALRNDRSTPLLTWLIGPLHHVVFNETHLGVTEQPGFATLARRYRLRLFFSLLAVVAVLATMLARYRRFRHILIFERRGWADRLVFAVALGLPLTAGVASRLLLNYNAADLTLEGAFLAGLIAGPYTGAIVGLMVATPALIAGEFIALPFAVGCGFAGGGLREACPKEMIWQFTPFVFKIGRAHV